MVGGGFTLSLASSNATAIYRCRLAGSLMYGNNIISGAFSPPETLSACTFFLLAASPVVGIWFTALGVSSMAFNLNGFNNPPIGGDSSLNSSLVGKVKG
jgi:hypothetical protein